MSEAATDGSFATTPTSPPPVFVVGVARSGTTLLSAMLASHSRLDCGPESRFFARLRHLDRRERRRLTEPAEWPAPAVEFIGSLENQGHPVVGLFDLDLDAVRTWLAPRPPSIAAMLESLTAQHAERAGKPRWVEKTPRHLLTLDELRESWPESAVIRIVRDPRDVAVSLSRMPFAGDSIVGNLIRIDHDDRLSRGFFARDWHAMTLRYEDLVREPEAELRRICGFLGEEFEPAMIDRGGSAESVAASHEWWKQSVGGALDTSRVGRWRSEMPEPEQRFAALHLGRFLREHGYEGARPPARRVTVLPVGDAVGPHGEPMLLALAERDAVVLRPAPRRLGKIRGRRALIFLGTRGQLDPSRKQPLPARLGTAFGLVALLALRRLKRRPVVWVRRATLLPRRPRDAGELLVAIGLRLFARSAGAEEAAGLVVGEPRAQGRGAAGGRKRGAGAAPAAADTRRKGGSRGKKR